MCVKLHHCQHPPPPLLSCHILCHSCATLMGRHAWCHCWALAALFAIFQSPVSLVNPSLARASWPCRSARITRAANPEAIWQEALQVGTI